MAFDQIFDPRSIATVWSFFMQIALHVRMKSWIYWIIPYFRISNDHWWVIKSICSCRSGAKKPSFVKCTYVLTLNHLHFTMQTSTERNLSIHFIHHMRTFDFFCKCLKLCLKEKEKCRRLRSLPSFRYIPIIMMTKKSSNEI